LLGDEPVLPYQRPPLSKDYLDGKIGLDLLLIRPEAFYRDHRIDYLPDTRAVEIDRAARQLRLASGEKLGYDHLVLATGARNRIPPLPIELDGVCYLRNLAEPTSCANGSPPPSISRSSARALSGSNSPRWHAAKASRSGSSS
jgi:3-phenylpropionate/trans-cinnamate dioxygenase ferredoxin reductase subunit